MTVAGASRASAGPGRDAPADAKSLVAGLDAAVSRAVDDLARIIASRTKGGEPPPVEALQQDAIGFGSTVALHLGRLADEVSKLAGAQPDRARAAVDRVGHYVAGWIDGGGIVLALLVDLPPERYADAAAIGDVLRPRLAFVRSRLESGLAPFVAAPKGPPVDPKKRLEGLLTKGAALGVRIKNVPEVPTDRYLDKLEAQLAAVEAKRAAERSAAAPRADRLKVLLDFADRLKVRVKQVPAVPTEVWLDKMEAKLVDVALKKGAPLPAALKPEAHATDAFAEERSATPARADAEAAGHLAEGEGLTTQEHPLEPFGEDRRRQVEALLEAASEAGLELGRVPPDPTEEWIAETRRRLDEAIERKRAQRKAERKKKEAERRSRVERLQTQATELGVDLGQFPPFPTDDWLARAELRIQAALLATSAAPVETDQRGERLRAALEAAEARRIDLGDVPPDPDEVWLAWAEDRIAEADASEEAIAVESDHLETPTAFLVFEEGTVQEQRWEVADGEVSIGRGRANTVQIRDDAGVSRRHCVLTRENGRWFLKDDGSTKGTFVNGRKATRSLELKGDESILCGETKFVFRVTYGPN